VLVQTKEKITLISEDADLTIVNIYNVSGELINSRHGIATDKVEFPVGNFSSGFYLVKSGDYSKSIIVKR
jgi:hypothetical protein